MDKERQVKGYPIGERSKKRILLLPLGAEALLSVPEGVEIRQELPSGELGPIITEELLFVGPGKFLAKNVKTGETKVINVNSNLNYPEKSA